jgi:hypothetical protein
MILAMDTPTRAAFIISPSLSAMSDPSDRDGDFRSDSRASLHSLLHRYNDDIPPVPALPEARQPPLALALPALFATPPEALPLPALPAYGAIPTLRAHPHPAPLTGPIEGNFGVKRTHRDNEEADHSITGRLRATKSLGYISVPARIMPVNRPHPPVNLRKSNEAVQSNWKLVGMPRPRGRSGRGDEMLKQRVKQREEEEQAEMGMQAAESAKKSPISEKELLADYEHSLEEQDPSQKPLDGIASTPARAAITDETNETNKPPTESRLPLRVVERNRPSRGSQSDQTHTQTKPTIIVPGKKTSENLPANPSLGAVSYTVSTDPKRLSGKPRQTTPKAIATAKTSPKRLSAATMKRLSASAGIGAGPNRSSIGPGTRRPNRQSAPAQKENVKPGRGPARLSAGFMVLGTAL